MKYLLSLSLAALIAAPAAAQIPMPHIINNSGGSYSNATAKQDFSVGEPVIVTLSGPGGALTQGFLQPGYGLLGIAALPQAFRLSAYPNPVTDRLFVEDPAQVLQSLVLYDVAGSVLLETSARSGFIPMRPYPPGTYILRAFGKNAQLLQSFKIQKQ